ncbi:hypothetical protein SAMN02745223_02946 [Devosia limi DSM 17137]|uniref:Uncharacterized protein n=1 Tax=Devosia limi DSM 17137 TaxID=1121477 RepID=A0A1M5CJX9_9HYPH|nr:hypothetical protein SAMN02745223_02946 [Devosia limi DSM 17137]
MTAPSLNPADLRSRTRRSIILGIVLAVIVVGFYVYSILVMGSAVLMKDL